MPKANTRVVLTSGEYLVKNRRGEDQQVAGARWEFIRALLRVLPRFVEELREKVYPKYALMADRYPRFRSSFSPFETWRKRSDPKNLFTPLLLKWAREFNVADETWLLEGALQTLHFWHQNSGSRESLDVQGFRRYVAVSILVNNKFEFVDSGWDPQFWSAESWRDHVKKRFEEAVDSHIKQNRKLIESRGAKRAVSRCSPEHFEWLALYQCGGWKLEKIRREKAKHAGDNTTISKGIHNAGRIAKVEVRPKLKKL